MGVLLLARLFHHLVGFQVVLELLAGELVNLTVDRPLVERDIGIWR